MTDLVPPRSQSPTMLLVEDEPAIRTVVRRTVAGTAYDLLVARNGDQARQHRGMIDLPQADVVMSRMNRFEPGELIGTAHPETTVLFVSDDSRDSAACAAGRAFRQKPFTQDALLGKIKEVQLA